MNEIVAQKNTALALADGNNVTSIPFAFDVSSSYGGGEIRTSLNDSWWTNNTNENICDDSRFCQIFSNIGFTKNALVEFNKNNDGNIDTLGSIVNPNRFTSDGSKGSVSVYFVKSGVGTESGLWNSQYADGSYPYFNLRNSFRINSDSNMITINPANAGSKLTLSDGSYILDRIIEGFTSNEKNNSDNVNSFAAFMLEISNASATAASVVGNDDILVKLNYVSQNAQADVGQIFVDSQGASHINNNWYTNLENGGVRMLVSQNSANRQLDLQNSTYSISGSVNPNDLGTFSRASFVSTDNFTTTGTLTGVTNMGVNSASFNLNNSIGTLNLGLSAGSDSYTLKETFDFANKITASNIPDVTISGGDVVSNSITSVASSIDLVKNGQQQAVLDLSVGQAILDANVANVNTTVATINGNNAEFITGGVLIPRN